MARATRRLAAMLLAVALAAPGVGATSPYAPPRPQAGSNVSRPEDTRIHATIDGIDVLAENPLAAINVPTLGDISPINEIRPVTKDGNVPSDLAAADFNRDGLIDLAIAYAWDDTVRWFFGRGDGRFIAGGAAYVGPDDVAANDFPRQVLARDFDSDGYVDLAVLCSGEPNYFTDPSLGILYGTHDGGFEAWEPIPLWLESALPPVFSTVLRTAEFGPNDRCFLLVGHGGSSQISIIEHGGRRAWKAPVLLDVKTTGYGPTALLVLDLGLDGTTDLIVANDEDVQVWRREASGEWAAPRTIAAGKGFSALDAADFDEDGEWDVVALDAVANQMFVFSGLGADATASCEHVIALSQGMTNMNLRRRGPVDMVVYDADLDGRDDLAVLYNGSDGGDVFFGQARLTDNAAPLRGRRHFDTAGAPRAIAAADFDRDGLQDLAFVHEGDLTSEANDDLIVGLNAIASLSTSDFVKGKVNGPDSLLNSYVGRPQGLAYDPMRKGLWTIDNARRELVLLTTTGLTTRSIPFARVGVADLQDATDLAVDDQGQLWIADRIAGRVRQVKPDAIADAAATAGGFPLNRAGLTHPSGIAYDGTRLLVSDAKNPRIVAFSKSGVQLASYEIIESGSGRAVADLAWESSTSQNSVEPSGSSGPAATPSAGRLWATLATQNPYASASGVAAAEARMALLDLDSGKAKVRAMPVGALDARLPAPLLRSVAAHPSGADLTSPTLLWVLTDLGALARIEIEMEDKSAASGSDDAATTLTVQETRNLALLRDIRSATLEPAGTILLADAGECATLVRLREGRPVDVFSLNDGSSKPVAIAGLSATRERGRDCIYALDGLRREVRKYTRDGVFVEAVGREALRQFCVRGLYVDATELSELRIYVGAPGRALVLDENGDFLKQYRLPASAPPGSLSRGRLRGEIMVFSPSRSLFFFPSELERRNVPFVQEKVLPLGFLPEAIVSGDDAQSLILVGSGETNVILGDLIEQRTAIDDEWACYR